MQFISKIILTNSSEINEKYKQYQYHIKDFSFFNYFTVTFIFTIISLIVMYSSVLIIMDLIDDNKYLSYNSLSEFRKLKITFKDMLTLNQSTPLVLGWFLIKYMFNFFSVFFLYKYNHPRYLRFMAEIISMISFLIISCIPFCFLTFKEKEKIISMELLLCLISTERGSINGI